MKIAVSACLLGTNCKYNDGNNYSEKVIEYIKGHEVVSVCPEVLRGAETALEIIKEQQADFVILQSRSPSCGVNTIYDGSFSGKIISGQGVFANLLQKNGIKVIDIADL